MVVYFLSEVAKFNDTIIESTTKKRKERKEALLSPPPGSPQNILDLDPLNPDLVIAGEVKEELRHDLIEESRESRKFEDYLEKAMNFGDTLTSNVHLHDVGTDSPESALLLSIADSYKISSPVLTTPKTNKRKRRPTNTVEGSINFGADHLHDVSPR